MADKKNNKSRGKCSAIPGEQGKCSAQHAFGSNEKAGLDTKEVRMYVCMYVCTGNWIKSTMIRLRIVATGGV